MRRTLPATQELQLFSQMNTTPLIDVLLVLLIMFILTIPAQTHKVAINLPGAPRLPSAPPELHRLSIEAKGGLRWNGAPIGDREVALRLRAIAANPDASLQLESAPDARYERFDEVLAEVKRAGITRLGFVGNDRYRF